MHRVRQSSVCLVLLFEGTTGAASCDQNLAEAGRSGSERGSRLQPASQRVQSLFLQACTVLGHQPSLLFLGYAAEVCPWPVGERRGPLQLGRLLEAAAAAWLCGAGSRQLAASPLPRFFTSRQV